MYVILSYDIEVKRVSKARKICLKYLKARHRSVYEGELSETKLKKLKGELARIVDTTHDRVCVWRMADRRLVSTDVLGLTEEQDSIV